MRLAVAELSPTDVTARHRLTADARPPGVKSPLVDACEKVAACAGGELRVLVEDRQTISEMYAR